MNKKIIAVGSMVAVIVIVVIVFLVTRSNS